MPALRIACLALLALALGGTTAFAQPSALNGARLPSEEVLNRYGLTRAWWGHSVTNSARDKVLHITADETTLYVQSSAGVITAFDNETGKRLWATQVGGSDRAMYAASSNDELLFVVNGMTLFAVQKSTGDVVWNLSLPGQPTSSPVADDRRIYLGFLDGSMYAFDFKKVAELHQKGMLPQWSYLTVLWRYKTSKAIVIPAVPNGTLVAFASRNGSLYSVGSQDRNLLFQFQTDASLSAPIARYKNQLLLASEDFNFYSVNIQNGASAWRFSAGMLISKAPVVVEDEVYVLPEHGGVHKLSPVTGKKFWSRPGIEAVMAVSPMHVYGKDRLNNLIILSRADGAPLGVFSVDRFTQNVVNDRTDRIYLATAGGLVVCLREIDRDFPVFHLHPERLQINPEFAPEVPEGEPADAAAPADPNAPEKPAAAAAETPEKPEM